MFLSVVPVVRSYLRTSRTAHLRVGAVPAQMGNDYVDTLLDYFNKTYYAIRQYSPDTFVMISPRIYEVKALHRTESASMHIGSQARVQTNFG